MSTEQTYIQMAIRFISVFLAYLISIGPAGYFRAWVAKKMGDTTAQENGLLTLDPFAHIDMFGLVSLALFGIGWGRNIPINSENIQGRFRSIKIAIAFFSDTVIHFVLSIVGIFAFIGAVYIFQAMPSALVDQAILDAVLKVISVFIQLNIFLAAVCMIYNGVALALIKINEQSEYEYSEYLFYGALFIPLLILLLWGPYLQGILQWFLNRAYLFIVWLVG